MQSNSTDDGAQMANSNLDDAQSIKDSIFRNFALLALPWLSFQQDMLLKHMSDALITLKNGNKTKSHDK